MAVLSGPRNKKAPASRPTVAGFLPFGEGDRFPQAIIDAISESDTASAAIQARAEFIIGDGIKDKRLANLVVNRHGETLNEVAEGAAWNISEGEVIPILVGYNGNGSVIDVRSAPWEQVRLAVPDTFGRLTHGGIFPFLDNQYVKALRAEHTLLPLFNPDPEVVLAQMGSVQGIQNYYGQLFYVKVGKPSADYYQTPSIYGSAKNLETENELTNYDFSTAVNGFNISGVWKQYKKSKPAAFVNGRGEEVPDPNSAQARFAENQGGENAGKILVFETDDMEALKAMTFVPTTGAELSDRYNSTNERVMQRIARNLRTPNELLNIRKQGGIAPTGEEMKVASQIMQQSVNKYQRRIAEAIYKVMIHWHQPLPSYDFTIGNINYFSDNGSTSAPQSDPS